jgi:hypothetical protein
MAATSRLETVPTSRATKRARASRRMRAWVPEAFRIAARVCIAARNEMNEGSFPNVRF